MGRCDHKRYVTLYYHSCKRKAFCITGMPVPQTRWRCCIRPKEGHGAQGRFVGRCSAQWRPRLTCQLNRALLPTLPTHRSARLGAASRRVQRPPTVTGFDGFLRRHSSGACVLGTLRSCSDGAPKSAEPRPLFADSLPYVGCLSGGRALCLGVYMDPVSD